jgi:hypothetical protein
MEIRLTWKKKVLNNIYEIFRDETKIGELINKYWSGTSFGELNSKKFKFTTKGFINQEAQITDPNDESVIGMILFSNWKTKTKIVCKNKEFVWRYDNILNTKWSISDESGVLVNYQSSAFDGDIVATTSDELLILSGLFIRNYIRQHSD